MASPQDFHSKHIQQYSLVKKTTTILSTLFFCPAASLWFMKGDLAQGMNAVVAICSEQVSWIVWLNHCGSGSVGQSGLKLGLFLHLH